ncbi:MAG: porin family protein [Bacteroidota bacterium]
MIRAKHLVLVMSLIFTTNIMYGQFQFGPKIGVGGSTQSELANFYDNEDIHVSYEVGLTVRNEFNDLFALKGDLLYSQKGRTVNIIEEDINYDQTDEFNYLIIPVKAEFSIPVKTSKVFLATGPYAGILLDASSEIAYTSSEIDNGSTDIKDQARNMDYGLSMELGVIIPVSINDLQISLNYDMGLTEVYEYDNVANNKSFTINLAYLF